MTKYSPPDINSVIQQIRPVRSTYAKITKRIDQWRQDYNTSVKAALNRPSIAIFSSFVNAMLERAMTGESYERRKNNIKSQLRTFGDFTQSKVRKMLTDSGYRFPKEGLDVVLASKEIVTSKRFSWKEYVAQAEKHYANDFPDDDFLKIKGVSYKTRDLALSELSRHFVAVDLHVVRVTTRTGLLLHGYGDPRITTAVGNANGYFFYHDFIIGLAKQTGWPRQGFSPGEIDRMFWHFGRTICDATPKCKGCPLSDICLTAKGARIGLQETGLAPWLRK